MSQMTLGSEPIVLAQESLFVFRLLPSLSNDRTSPDSTYSNSYIVICYIINLVCQLTMTLDSAPAINVEILVLDNFLSTSLMWKIYRIKQS